MDKKRGRPSEARARAVGRKSPPPVASRTRSKSPARVESSGRDSAPITRPRRQKKNDTPSEESSSQSSTPKKEVKKSKTKKSPVAIVDDSAEDEVAEITNTRRSTRLGTLRQRLTPVNYKLTPTPSQGNRSASSITNENSQDESDEVEIVERPPAADLGIWSKPAVVASVLVSLVVVPVLLHIALRGPLSWSRIVAILGNGASYCNRQSGSFYAAFWTSTILIPLIPIGRVPKIPGSEAQSRCSGLLTAGVIVAFLVGLELRGLDSLTAIFNNIDRFLYLGIFVNMAVAASHFILNRKKATDGFILSFVNGIETNPKFAGLIDSKSIAYTRSIVMILVVNIALLFKNVTVPVVESSPGAPLGELIRESWNNLVFVIQHAEYHCASLVVSSLLVLYALDALVFQHHLAASYQSNGEGCGAEFFLRTATFPFLVSLTPRYLLVRKPEISCWVSAVVVVVFLIGLISKRRSNALKYEYRSNPSDPRFKELKTLQTLKNNRLITGCWWSYVRHPGHYAEIISHVALLIPLAFSFNWPSAVGILFIIAYIVRRTIIINKKCAHKYESAWQRLTAAIKYNIVPRVY